MKRLTTNNPKDMIEKMHNVVFAKDNELYLRGFGENGEDISLVNYCKNGCSAKCCKTGELPEDLEGFEEMMMQCDCHTSTLYWVCVGFGGLRQRLMQYEDELGEVSPEEIKETIARNCVAWDTSKDKREGLLPEVVVFRNPDIYKKLFGEEYNFIKACKKYVLNIKRSVKK